MSDLCDKTAVELRRLIGRKDISPLELLESCITRIEATDGAVNAVVTRPFDCARDEALHAEKAVLKGEELGLLHGLPVGIKDLEATGATAAVLMGAAVPVRIMRGFAVISRAAGLVAHVMEEQQNPAGRHIWDLVDNNIPYTGNALIKPAP